MRQALRLPGIAAQQVWHAWNKRNHLFLFEKLLAGEPGFEPGLTESESVGLPLTYSPASAVMNRAGRAAKPLERCLVAASGK